MRRIDLINFNKEFLQKLKAAGVRLDDYKYCEMYQDYVEMTKAEQSRKVVILTLAERYNVTDRQVYNIIRHLEKSV